MMNIPAYLVPFGLLFLCLAAFVGEAAVCVIARRRKWRPHALWLLPGVLLLAGIVWGLLCLLPDTAWAQGYSPAANTGTAAARLFLCLLPAMASLGAMAACRLRRAWLWALMIALLLGLSPVRLMMKDGGSTVYASLLYRITFYHRFDDTRPTGYRTDTDMKVFPFHFIAGDD